MNFNFAEIFSSDIGLLQIITTLGFAFIVGLFLFFIYKKTFGGVMYSRNLNISFMMLTMVTSLMLLLINSNLTLSLGMVGALSIIRFRTAVKDPMDTVFMFWAVGEGIAIGTQFYFVAIIAAVFIGIFLLIMSVTKGKANDSYLLIVHYDHQASSTIKQALAQLPKYKLKSKVVRPEYVELTLELRLNDREVNFVDKLIRIEGVNDATLITHQGDIVG